MPLYEERRNLYPVSAFRRVERKEPPQGSVLGAAFRQENIVANLMRDDRAPSGVGMDDAGYARTFGEAPQSDFNAWGQIEGTKYEDYWDEFMGVRSASEAARVKTQIDGEMRDRAILDSAGGRGLVAQLFAGLVDVPSLVPGASAVRGATRGASIAQNAARTSRAALAEAAAVEAALQSLQATRTGAESAAAIGGSVVLGAMLGGSVGALLRRSPSGEAAMESAGRFIDGQDAPSVRDDLDAALAKFESDSIGAARVEISPDAQDFLLPTKAAQRVVDLTPRGTTFGLTFLKARSPVAQKYGLELVDTPFAVPGVDKLNMEPAAEVAQSVAMDRYRTVLARAFRDNYADYRKSVGVSRLASEVNMTGGNLTQREFGRRVAMAMRRGDVDDLPQVAKAAQKIREEVIEPLKERAIRAGLLPEDVEVSTAASYFTRVWDTDEITKRSVEFKKRLADHFERDFRGLRAGGKDGFETLTDVELRGDAEIAAESVYNTLTSPGRFPDNLNLTVKVRGPMKERTLNVRDLDFEDFLSSDAELITNRYARVMTADVTLKERFDSADMERVLREVAEDYNRLIDDAESLPKAERDKVRSDLRGEQQRVLERMEAVRDLMRGTYQIGIRSGVPYRVIQSALTYNFIRALGGLVLSALPDVMRLTMANGIGPTWEGAVKPLVRNMKGYRLQARQARELAGISEVELNNRLMRIADVTDPLGNQTPVENAINAMGGWASTLSGGTLWNDFLKGMATQVTTARLRRLTDSADDTRFRQRLKLNKRDAEAIRDAMQKHGVEVGGIFDPRTMEWPERVREIYAQALRADADTVIVTPGIGDKVPGAEHHYWLKPALQFKSFAIAAHSRVMVAGLQENQARFLASAGSMAAMGMFVYWVKGQQSGVGTSDNLGTWIAEGIDRSGVFPLIMEVNNWAESLGAPGVYNILSMGEDEASRYAVRGTADRIMGPTAGLINDTATALSRAVAQINPVASEENQKITPGDISAMRRLVPFGRHPGVKEYLDLWLVPNIKEGLN